MYNVCTEVDMCVFVILCVYVCSCVIYKCGDLEFVMSWIIG